MDFTQKLARKNSIMLFIAFFLPVITAVGVILPNVSMLGTSQVPFTIKIELVYPLLAAIALLFILKMSRTTRGISYIAIAIIPFLIIFFDDNVGRLISRSIGRYGAMMQQMFSSTLPFYIGILAVLALLTGSVIAQAKPDNKIAPKIAMAGGILYFVSLIYPVTSITGTTIGILAPYQMGTMRGANEMMVFVMIVLYANMALMILASVKAIMMGKSSRKDIVGKKIIKLWFSSLSLYLSFGLLMLFNAPSSQLLQVILMVSLVSVKILAWIFGLYLLIPLGIAEIVMGTTENNTPPPEEIETVNRFEQ